MENKQKNVICFAVTTSKNSTVSQLRFDFDSCGVLGSEERNT